MSDSAGAYEAFKERAAAVERRRDELIAEARAQRINSAVAIAVLQYEEYTQDGPIQAAADAKSYIVDRVSAIVTSLPSFVSGDSTDSLTPEEVKIVSVKLDEAISSGQLQVIEQNVINSDKMKEDVPLLPERLLTQLDAIQQRGNELAAATRTVQSLGLGDVDVQVQITGLHEIADRCESLAREIGLAAIADGRISQVQLSRMLGVAPLTVGRWVKAAQESTSES